MKVIIAGSRTITNYKKVKEIILKGIRELLIPYSFREHFNLEIVSGGAKGVDFLAERFAKEEKFKFVLFPANWGYYAKQAGYLRNIEMANYADALIAVWDGKSKGTKHMIDIAKKKGLKVYVCRIQRNS
jgi:hypothetical protein